MESKFEGDEELRRKHIIVDKIIHIGNEAKNLEFIGLKNPDYLSYENQELLREKLKTLEYSDVKKVGISKTTWHYIQKRLKGGKKIKLNRKTIGKLNSCGLL